MSWPNFNPDGSLAPFTSDQLKAMNLIGPTALTADIRDGAHPTFELDSQGCSIRRAWFTPWAQRDNAIAALLGGSGLYGAGTAQKLSRVMPMVFPDPGYEQYAGMALESVTGARSSGKNDANNVPAYSYAKIVIRHEQVFWGLAPDNTIPEYNRYVETLPSTVETSYLSLTGSMMNFLKSTGVGPSGAGPILIPYSIGRVETMTRIAYKWHRVPYEAWYPGSPLYLRVHGDPSNSGVNAFGKALGLPYAGTVSSATMLGYPAGYALFEGVEEEIVPDPVRGFPCWNLTYKFLVKNTANSLFQDGGHNYLYYGGTATDGLYAGYYFAVKGSTFYSNGSLPDGKCIYNERQLLNLWNVAEVVAADI